jgi:hypothetical protein
MTTRNQEAQADTAAAQSTAERAKEEVARVGDAAKEEASQVVEQAKDQGRALVAEASDRLKGEAEHQSERAAHNLRSISTDFRTMAESSEGSGPAVSWVRMGADQLDSLAGRLENGGFDGVVKDVGNFARRNPTLFLFTTFSAGLMAGRLMKNLDMDRIRGTEPAQLGASTSSSSGAVPQPAGTSHAAGAGGPDRSER